MKKLLPLLLALALLAGCAPGATPTPTPVEKAISGPAVHTDWSQLTPYEPFTQVARRWEGRYAEELIPSPDYGTLVPFLGQISYYTPEWVDEGSEPWKLERYGLMTLKGEIVVEPVYTSVGVVCWYDNATMEVKTLPLWILQGVAGEEGGAPMTLAAQDGSWVADGGLSDGSWAWCSVSEDGVMLVEGDALVMRNLDGSERFRWTMDDLPAGVAELGDSLDNLLAHLSWRDGIGLLAYFGDQCWYADGAAGQWLDLPVYAEANTFSEGLAAVRGDNGLWGYIDLQGNWNSPPQFDEAQDYANGRAMVRLSNGCLGVVDTDGDLLLELETPEQSLTPAWKNGEQYFLLYAPEGEYNYTLLGWYDGLMRFTDVPQGPYMATVGMMEEPLWWRDGDTLTILGPSGPQTLPAGLGVPQAMRGDKLVLCDPETSSDWTLVTLDGEVLVEKGRYTYLEFLSADAAGGERTLLRGIRQEGGSAILDENGVVLLTSQEDYMQGYHGVFQVRDEVSFGCKNLNGEWLLRLSDLGGGDD